MKRITFEVSADGRSTQIKEVTGFGSTCKEATKNFEKALGSTDEGSRQETSELYENDGGNYQQEQL